MGTHTFRSALSGLLAALLLVFGASVAHAQNSVTASWDRNTDAHTAGYRVYYGTSSGSYQWSFDAGNQVTAPITLSSGSAYFFVVRAYNAQYDLGPQSVEASLNLTPNPEPTAQITATLQSASSALVTWQTANAASASINGTAVSLNGSTTVTVTAQTTFRITATAADGRTATATASVTPTALAPTAQITARMQSATSALVTWQTANAASATINGNTVALSGQMSVPVTAQTTFQIVARAADGRTATASAVVTPTAPAPTAQITATMQTATTALVTWQTANAATATIDGNAVALSGQMSVAVSAPTTFQIVARAADGRTASASAAVSPAPTPAPTAAVSATLQGSNTAVVTWQTANAVSATLNGQAVALAGSVSVPVTATTTFTLRAVNAAGVAAQSSATVNIVTPTAPGAPRNLAAAVSGTRVTLTWLVPSSGTTPTHYLVDVGSSTGASDMVSAYNVGNLLTVSADLARGTYYVRVRAANATGTSTPSNEVRFSIGRRLRTPSGFQVLWEGTTATLSWTASSGDSAEDAPANYVLEAGTTPGTTNIARVNVGKTTRFSTAIPSGTYYVRVRAENSLGESEPSREIELRAPGVPQAPTALVATGAGPVVDLRWTPAGGPKPTGYLIEAGSAPGLANLAQLQVGDVARFTTTAPAGTYYVRVRALSGQGPSGPSNEIVVRR